VRRGYVFGPASVNFTFQGFSYNAPYGSLNLSATVTALESGLSEKGVLRPYDNLLLRLVGFVFMVVGWVELWA
jgi:hypothetical protein